MEIITNNPTLPWIWHNVSKNPNITLDFILKHIDKPWAWTHLSKHPNITIENIIDNIDLPWNMGVCLNPNLNGSNLCKLPRRLIWYWYLSQNKSMNMQDILTMNETVDPQRYDDSRPVMMCHNGAKLTVDVLRSHTDIKWDWHEVSENSGITMDDVKNNPDLPWQYWGLTRNPNVTLDMINSEPDRDWNWYRVSWKEL
jgi:hypothetical protein